MSRLVHFLVLLVGCLLTACSKPSADALEGTDDSQSAGQVYEVKGIVRGIDTAHQSMMVEHEEVPNYMPAMTMPFDVKSMSDIGALKVGDAVKFRLLVKEKRSWIEAVTKIDPAQVKLAPKRTSIVTNTPITEPLKLGDRLPDFQLTDQNGKQITRETFMGKPVFITFIFTRCPIPNFCPRMSQNFVEIQKALAGTPREQEVKFLSISFDPAFDTPEVLSTYAKQYSADAFRWHFATGTPEQIKRLTEAFGVYVQPEQGSFNHGLATALIGPDGVVRKILRGNSWPATEAVEALDTF